VARSRGARKAARTASAARKTLKRAKDVKVKHGGHKHREVNVPKAW
jgi:hypothetical protein